MSTKYNSTYSAVMSITNQLIEGQKYDSTYSAVLSIYQSITNDYDTTFDSTYSIVSTIANGIEDGTIQTIFNSIKFIDLYGNIVALWNLKDLDSYTELPNKQYIEFGEGDMLYQIDWQYTIGEIKDFTQPIQIGAVYQSLPYSLVIVDVVSNDLTVKLSVTGFDDIDWGDGTVDSSTQHTYTSAGKYNIKIYGTHSFNFNGGDKKIKTIISNATSNVFKKLTGLETVVLPSNATTINGGAFMNCTNLNTLILPPSITSIGNDAFDSVGIKKLLLNEGLETVGNDFLYLSNNIEELYIPSTVKSFSNMNAFCYGCPTLKSITVSDNNTVYSSLNGVMYNKNKTNIIKYPEGKEDKQYIMPDSVTSTSSYSFYKSKIEYFVFNDTITTTGDRLISFSENLRNVKFGNNMTQIGNMVFYGCTGLKKLNITDSIEIVGSQFIQDSGIEVLNIGSGLKTISDYGIYACPNLKEINVDLGNQYFKSIDGILYTKNGSMLKHCPCSNGIVDYVIPEGCTTTDIVAFMQHPTLETVKFPSTFTTILDECFYGCPKLKVMDFSDCEVVVSLGADALTGSTTLEKIIVPEHLLDSYKTNWKQFTNIITK